ncbi:Endo-beta-1,4-glucanase B Short=Endoglucanase B; AltName: Full=Carboxymethylcellulase B; AltName: Full=Cellulase B; Flags: Precursor [Serendipita indica DSM 11827]|nr:Endo-beta-1,4-glucanase B Short=Endoglucanase B; AltName: Full=Carboxymethylcellulase B; AltName: Full=Cellulase B; Flags: Precursor [Serendipita indica DSM 11827]
MKLSLSLAVIAALLPQALGISRWDTCGGGGVTTGKCDDGLVCVELSEYYYQCLKLAPPYSPTSTSTSTSTSTRTTSTTLSSSTSTLSSSSSTSTSQSTSTSISTTTTSSTSSSTSATSTYVCPGAKKFKYFGVNESSAEFGSAVPGTLNKDYTWPSPSSVDYFLGKGMNFFRIPFMMERMSPPATGLTGPVDTPHLTHNYARYNGSVITDVSLFKTWWKNMATEFLTNDHVIFDLNNEPWGIPATDAAALMQAGLDGVRAAGATQSVFVQGTSWTGAWSWESSGNGDAFKTISDPLNNVVIEMHQYLDTDGSGTNSTCVSPTVGAERLQVATNWLKANNKKGFIGELGAGSNNDCISAIRGALCLMQTSDVWIGFAWWAAGPWWGNYYQSIEPPSGPAIARILPEALLPFA